MNEKVEYKGKWFLPSDVNKKVFGTIKYVPHEGTTLELFGEFSQRDYSKLQFIWGILSNGKFVTLYNCFIFNYQINSSEGFNLSIYRVNFLIIGAHFKDNKDLSFNKVNIKFANLDSWLDISGFEKERANDRRELNIKYKLPEDIEFPINSSKTFSIRNTYLIPGSNQRQEITIKQSSYIQIEYRRKNRLTNILKDINHVQNLFVLFMQSPVLIESIELSFKIGNNAKFHNANLYFALLKPQYKKDELHWIDMVISYKDISIDLETITKNWMNLQGSLSTVCNPYFSTFHSPFFYVSDLFLNLARAVEAFHRETINNGKVHFKVRVEEVLKIYSKCYNGLLEIKSKPQFADRIKILRNLFTHSNPLETDSNKHSLELYYYSERLQIVLACAIMNYIGLNKEVIKKKIEWSRRYTHIKYKMK